MARKYKLTQDGPEVQALLNKIDGLKANQAPGQGVEPIQMENLSLDGVLYAFLTSAVSNLLYYYTKSETYTKSEVNTMVAAIKQFTIQSVDQLPQPSAETTNILYLVPAEEPKVANEKDEFITVIKDGSYAWEQIGSTAIDLSGYVTTEALNTALADYVTSDALETALAGLHDVKYTAQSLTDSQKLQARTNIDVPSTGEMATAIANSEKVFIAEYGTTTYSELLAAYNAGKAVFCFYNSDMYALTALTLLPSFVFVCQKAESQYRIICVNSASAANSWSVGGTTTFQEEIQDLETIRMGANRANGVIADSVEGITIEQRSGYYYNSSGTKTASSNSRYCSCQIVAGHYYFIEGRIGNPSQFGVSCPGTSQSPKTQPIDPSTGQKYASYIVADITASGKTGGYILIPNGVNTIQFTAAYNTQNATTIKLYDLGSTPQTQPIFSGEPYVIDLGRLNDLETTEKDTVVGALNEVVNGVSGRESKTNKVQTITGNESSQVKYPSTKAVADALAAKYTKPVNGIPASDLATGVIPDVSGKEDSSNKSQSVETDKTSNTKYPSTKAVWDGLKVRPVMDETSQATVPSLNLENTANKSQDVQTDRESIAKYPSVKAVFDSLGKWGVISQTQTWTGSNATGYDYTMSNLVWGLIPQANIDLYVSAGAVFNETTGYFELNGLTDISYNEMKEIYCSSFGKDREPQLENVLAGKACRTNYSFYSSSYTGYGSFGTTATRIGAVCKSSTIEIFNYENSGSDNSVVSKNKLFAASGGVSQAFAYAQKLHTIIGVMQVRDCSSLWMTFEQCYSLVNVKLRGVKADVLFSHSSRLSLDSVVFLVDNATNTSAITITLHPTAYARCQADTTEYTYNGQTYTGIIALATAKNITIASA